MTPPSLDLQQKRSATKPPSSPGFTKILLEQLQGYLSEASSLRTSLGRMDTELSQTFGVNFGTDGEPSRK